MEKMRQKLLLKHSPESHTSLKRLEKQLEEVKIFTHKPIKTNALFISLTDIFEYTVSFAPQTVTENAKLTFLKRFFCKIGTSFSYRDNRVFTVGAIEERLRRYCLFNRKMGENVTVILIPQGKCKFNADLFRDILDRGCELFTPISGVNVAKIVYFLRQCRDSTLLLFTDCEYYISEPSSVDQVLISFKQLHGENRYRDAFKFFLYKSYVHCVTNNNIYKCLKVDWEKNAVIFNTKTRSASANFGKCHFAKRVLVNSEESMCMLREQIEKFLSQMKLNFDFVNVNGCTLPAETITFGDGITCTKTVWDEDLKNNEVFTSVELWCWVIIYETCNEELAKNYSAALQELQDDFGVSIGRPLYFPITGNSKSDYVNALQSLVSEDLQLVVVILSESENKPEALIKHICCIKNPVPTELIYSSEIKLRTNIQNSLLRINAMLGGTLWSVSLPEKVMVCAIDTYIGFDKKTSPVCATITNLVSDGIQWYSKINFLDENSIRGSINDAIHKYFDINGQLPTQIVIYHTCSPALLNNALEQYKNLHISLKVTVILVNNECKLCCLEEVAVGTVIRDKISESINFFLYSSAGEGVPRPVHYSIIKDTAGVSSSFLERLTYRLCYLYYKHPNVAYQPAPCIYARKLSKLVTETIYGIPSQVLNDYLYYL